MLRNFIQISSEGLRLDGTAWLVVYILLALALSAFIWWVCTNYTKLWNKVYKVTPACHVLCGIAAVITFFGTLGFIGLKNMRPVAEEMVEEWSEDVMDNEELSERCFREAYYAIKESGLEDMRGYRTPENGGDLIPISRKETQILVGQLYAGNACQDFAANYPFIGYFIKAHDGVPSEVIAADINAFFQSRKGRTYPLEQGFVLAIEKISSDLQSQCGRIVRVCRGWLILLFLLVQLVPFGLIGYLAYEELQRNRRTGKPLEDDVDFDIDNI
ncbi:MAG: hypothetical protein J5917_03685 [Bacteroidales bacterium]|nr:hypothetical protein [Bacteroidales bacterium]